MKKIALFAGVLLALSASMASAQGGINLSWGPDCGLAGTVNLTNTCTTNTGNVGTMVASFDPPHTLTQFLGISAQIDITTDQPTLPDWWQIGTGFCRPSAALQTNFDGSTALSCIDVYANAAAGGYAYDVGFGTPARARFRVQCAVPIDNVVQVDPGTEYFAFKAIVTKAKSLGTGACAGCANSACIVLNEVQLFQPPEAADDPRINNPRERQFITYQLPPTGPIGCPASTPTRNSSWGQVKSLYR